VGSEVCCVESGGLAAYSRQDGGGRADHGVGFGCNVEELDSQHGGYDTVEVRGSGYELCLVGSLLLLLILAETDNVSHSV